MRLRRRRRRPCMVLLPRLVPLSRPVPRRQPPQQAVQAAAIRWPFALLEPEVGVLDDT